MSGLTATVIPREPNSVDRVAAGREAMVATASSSATEIGRSMLREGGNAVDAAVAAAWALSVCEPSGSGLGGQTTALVRFSDGRALVLDGHSYAPAAVSPVTVRRRDQRRGRRASTIPSTVATLGALQERFGSLPRERVLGPAIALAEDGFPASPLLRRHIQWCRSALARCPVMRRTFLRDGHPVPVGSVIRQPALARTLRGISRDGCGDFYQGTIARQIARDMRENGGLLTADDLEGCRFPVEREPLAIRFMERLILTTPPPGGGLQLLLGLRIMEALHTEPHVPDEDWYEMLAGVILAVFRERARRYPRPDRMPRHEVERLLQENHAREIAAHLWPTREHAERSSEEPGDTTHVCAVDGNGLAVSLTQSIQSLFGAKVAGKELGFLYNNYLWTMPRDRRRGEPSGGAMPQSNAAPTIALRGPGARDAPGLVLGAAGSRRITSSLLQTLARHLGRGEPLPEAIGAPRIHATMSGKVMIERRAASRNVLRRLERRFRRIEVKSARSYFMGATQGIAWDEAQGAWIGVADPRREGTAGGL